jgi:putative hydrolase of the HAD superfamily
MFDLIAFDADDTLWHNESLYVEAQGKLRDLLTSYGCEDAVEEALLEKELGNLPLYGYGIKSFSLSMIETAIELTEAKILAQDILRIIGFAKEMLQEEVQLFENTAETIRELSTVFDLMIITKGDLRDQEVKLLGSGIAGFFQHIEIVSEKDLKTYESLLIKYGVDARRFLMIGNSLRSDILPVLELGGHAVYIPYHQTWAHEYIDDETIEHEKYHQINDIGKLPRLLQGMTKKTLL